MEEQNATRTKGDEEYAPAPLETGEESVWLESSGEQEMISIMDEQLSHLLDDSRVLELEKRTTTRVEPDTTAPLLEVGEEFELLDSSGEQELLSNVEEMLRLHEEQQKHLEDDQWGARGAAGAIAVEGRRPKCQEEDDRRNQEALCTLTPTGEPSPSRSLLYQEGSNHHHTTSPSRTIPVILDYAGRQCVESGLDPEKSVSTSPSNGSGLTFPGVGRTEVHVGEYQTNGCVGDIPFDSDGGNPQGRAEGWRTGSGDDVKTISATKDLRRCEHEGDILTIVSSTPEPSCGRTRKQLTAKLSPVQHINTFYSELPAVTKDRRRTGAIPKSSGVVHEVVQEPGLDTKSLRQDDIPQPSSMMVNKDTPVLETTPPPPNTDDIPITGASGTDVGGADQARTENNVVRRVVINGLRRERTCTYLTGGICTVHGAGATKNWKPKMIRKKGPDGKYKMRMTKEIYYVCVNNIGRGARIQTRISFGAVLDIGQELTRETENTTQGELGNQTIQRGN